MAEIPIVLLFQSILLGQGVVKTQVAKRDYETAIAESTTAFLLESNKPDIQGSANFLPKDNPN